MDGVSPVLPIQNRPGMYAVLSPEAAQALKDGCMKLYFSPNRGAEVELITRTRKPLAIYDPQFRLIFAVIHDGKLYMEAPS